MSHTIKQTTANTGIPSTVYLHLFVGIYQELTKLMDRNLACHPLLVTMNRCIFSMRKTSPQESHCLFVSPSLTQGEEHIRCCLTCDVDTGSSDVKGRSSLLGYQRDGHVECNYWPQILCLHYSLYLVSHFLWPPINTSPLNKEYITSEVFQIYFISNYWLMSHICCSIKIYLATIRHLVLLIDYHLSLYI